MSVLIKFELDDEFALEFLDFFDLCNDLDGINDKTAYIVDSSFDLVQEAVNTWPEEYKEDIRKREYKKKRIKK